MEEFENSVTDYQEDVVDSQESNEEVSQDEYVGEDGYEEPEIDEGVEEPQENSEIAEPKQSKEDNAKFASIRRKAEEEAKAKYQKELEELREEKERFKEAQRKEQRKQEEARIDSEALSEITPDKIYELASEMGVSENYAVELLKERAMNEANRRKSAYYDKLQQIEVQKQELRSKPFFDVLEKDIDEMIKKQPDLLPQTAYLFLRGEKFEELMEQKSSVKEKSMIANMQDKARRKPVGSDGTPDQSRGMSEFGKEFAVMLGVDPRDAAKVVKDRGKRRR